MVTCKFKVNRVTPMQWATEVELTPDYADGKNEDWKAATPAGVMRLTVANEKAIAGWEAGDEVEIHLHRTPKVVS